MNIIGEFPVQNSDDAKHWVATVNFLRTATKMFFGDDDGLNGLKGNPPPILHLYGYGDHMFNKVPVVINSFNKTIMKEIISFMKMRLEFQISNNEKISFN